MEVLCEKYSTVRSGPTARFSLPKRADSRFSSNHRRVMQFVDTTLKAALLAGQDMTRSRQHTDPLVQAAKVGGVVQDSKKEVLFSNYSRSRVTHREQGKFGRPLGVDQPARTTRTTTTIHRWPLPPASRNCSAPSLLQQVHLQLRHHHHHRALVRPRHSLPQTLMCLRSRS